MSFKKYVDLCVKTENLKKLNSTSNLWAYLDSSVEDRKVIRGLLPDCKFRRMIEAHDEEAVRNLHSLQETLRLRR